MWNRIATLALALSMGAPARGAAQPVDDRLYGRVLTAEGERLEGWLRWDRNETHAADMLDGQKEIPWAYEAEAERLDEELRRRRRLERSINLPGLRITWDEDDGDLRTTSAAIRFGHLRSLEVVEERRVRLTLTSGDEVELVSGSTDIGPRHRGLVVEAREGDEVELRWRDLRRVDFLRAPAGMPAPRADRLHGTVRTREGVELTGWIAWDTDEALTTDVLDGREGGRRVEIELGTVAAIAREGRGGARVTLRSGEERVLRGTNDVNASNGGIEVSDAGLGRAVVSWEDFVSVRFHPPEGGGGAPSSGHAAFPQPRPLSGSVEARTGEMVSGRIRWDNDESSTWEVLDGRAGDVDYDVELGLVRSIERVDASSARVELRDGRTLHLEGTNDVGEENGGIFVQPEGGETVLVRWEDFVRVSLDP